MTDGAEDSGDAPSDVERGEADAAPSDVERGEADATPSVVERGEADAAPSDVERDEADAAAESTRATSGVPELAVEPPSRAGTWIVAGIGVLVAIIAVDVAVILRNKAPATAATTKVEPTPMDEPDGEDEGPAAPSASAAQPESAVFYDGLEDEGSEKDDEADDEPEPEPKPVKRAATVREAANRTCSTAIVDGLSRQIIGQARCIDPRAFAAVPKRPNLVARKNVYLYLNAAARDKLLAALDANRGRTLTVNSALRTVAQQYLLSRWGANKRCGVQLAAEPGDSNHETGLALDIAEPYEWRAALEKHGFEWMGKIDKVHFDYKGGATVSRIDVRAFQQLWNRNHPDDKLRENGRYDDATDKRLAKSPPDGFPKGASCSR